MNNIGTIIALVLGLILVAAVFIGVLYASIHYTLGRKGLWHHIIQKKSSNML